MSASGRSSLAVTGLPVRPLAWLVVPFVALVSVVLPAAMGAAPARAATPGSITLTVASARTNADTNQNPDNLPIVHKGDPVATYKWLVTVDDVGNAESKTDAALNACLPYGKSGTVPGDLAPQAAYNPGDGTKAGASAPGACQWPSTRTTPGAVDVVASGDQTDLNGTKSLDLPAGKYLISVTADNFKIDGEHFTVTEGGSVPVAVTMQPYPLPLGAVRYKIFSDTIPVDGTYEADAEQGLGGFVGHITDVLGEVTTDFFGNRLCTNYVHRDHLAASDPNYTQPGDVPLAGYSRSNYDPYSPVLFDADGAAIIDTNDPGGTCYSDRNGDIVMPNLGPDRYAASAVAPSGQQWYQTNTLEGSHDWDIWMAEGETGYDNEMTVGAEKVSNTQLGFVPWGYNLTAAGDRTGPKTIGVTSASASAATGGLRTVTLGLGSANSTTLAARSTIHLSRTITLTTRVGTRIYLLLVPAGDYVVTQGGLASVSFLLQGGGLGTPATVAFPTANVSSTITAPDAGPALWTSGGHTVSGTVVMLNAYIGGTGGVTVPETQWAGASVKGPIKQPIVTLSDLEGNDQMVQVARWGDSGQFAIPHVPDGSYQLTFWDFEQDTIIDSTQIVVKGGDVNVGQKGLVGWWTEIRGSVFIDANGNGRRDPGEAGVPQFLLTFKERDNSQWDQGINAATTDKNGDYVIREAYPVTKWSILEAFNTRYHTTGISVQADNENAPTTYLGAAVDLNVLPIIGLGGRVDWGVKAYSGSENGGIAGTVTYDTTRNELDPADAVTEPYQPGIPGMTVHLFYPLRDANGDLVTNPDGSVAVVKDADGNPLKVQDDYTSETWEAPKGCTARDYKGNPLVTGREQLALPPAGNTQYQCVEAPMTGWQAIPADTTEGNFGQNVNGNYAFADMNFDPDALAAEATRQGEALKSGDATQGAAANSLQKLTDSVPLPNGDDFIVKVDSVKDLSGKDIYKPTREEDVNVFDGDVRMPQENYPLPASDVQPGSVNAPDPGQGGPISQTPGIVSGCAGANHTVHVTSPGLIAAGGSPYEGKQRPLCDAKVVTIRANQTVAPNFNYFSDVPLPTHFWGLTINDLGLTHDKQSIGYGEAQGLPFVPMGIYDWSGRLVDTVQTDYNGMYEAIEPSTSSYNCPLPAGPCPGMFYFKGNDPGVPGHPNPDYNPRFRTIGTNFQAWPGLYTVTDTAPTQVAQVTLQPSGDQVGNPVCDVSGDTPNVMAVSSPYVRNSGVSGPPTTATGQNLAVSRAYAVRLSTTRRSATIFTSSALNGPTTPVASGQQITVAGATGTFAPLNGTWTVTGVLGNTITFDISPGTGFGTVLIGSAVSGVTVKLPNYTVPGVTSYGPKSVTIKGTGFGASPQVTLTATGSTTAVQQTVTSAGDTSVTVTLTTGNDVSPTNRPLTPGTYQLSVRNTASNKNAVNGLTFHVLGTLGTVTYDPVLIQVNPPADAPEASSAQNTFTPKPADTDLLNDPETAIQRALDRAATPWPPPHAERWSWSGPASPPHRSPTGDYFENLIVHSNVKIQGVGPGGFQGHTYVPGTRINGLGFQPDNPQGANWIATLQGLGQDPDHHSGRCGRDGPG